MRCHRPLQSEWMYISITGRHRSSSLDGAALWGRYIYLKPQIVTVVSQAVTSGWKRIFEIFQ
jgi:hypothetical protein